MVKPTNSEQLQINLFKLLIYLKNNYNSKLIGKYLKKDWCAYLNFLECLEERKIAQTMLNTKPFVLYLDPISYCNLQYLVVKFYLN